MRTIKFRGFSVALNEFVYGLLEYNKQDKIYYIDGYIVYTKTISQFTGLYDIDGKEIYEGDIVNCEELSFSSYEVKYHQGSFIITPYKTKETLKDPLDESYHINTFTNDFETSKTKLKIIGNIYENFKRI